MSVAREGNHHPQKTPERNPLLYTILKQVHVGLSFYAFVSRSPRNRWL
jgi:hypothetical protein